MLNSVDCQYSLLCFAVANLLFMNSANKTEAVVFPMQAVLSGDQVAVKDLFQTQLLAFLSRIL